MPDWSMLTAKEKGEEVAKVYTLGMSGAELRQALAAAGYRISRNAAAGFCHRNQIKLGGGKKAGASAENRGVNKRVAKLRRIKAVAEQRHKQPSKPPKSKSEGRKVYTPQQINTDDPKTEMPYLAAKDKNCAWPLWSDHKSVLADPENLRVCGSPVSPGSRYCAHHRARGTSRVASLGDQN